MCIRDRNDHITFLSMLDGIANSFFPVADVNVFSICLLDTCLLYTSAAHECGHAIQHARGYVPLKLRGALVPVANFGSAIAWPLILLGLLFNSNSSAMFLNMGVLAFSMSVLFQVVTLPVEFNASGRALRILVCLTSSG